MGLRNTVSATQPTLSYRGTRSARNEIAHFNYARSIVSRWGHHSISLMFNAPRFKDGPAAIPERASNTQRGFVSTFNIRLAFASKNSTKRLSCMGRMLA